MKGRSGDEGKTENGMNNPMEKPILHEQTGQDRIFYVL